MNSSKLKRMKIEVAYGNLFLYDIYDSCCIIIYE